MSLNFTTIESPPEGIRGRSLGRGQIVMQWGEPIGEELVAITARGTLQIQDGTSNTVMVSDGTGSTASCSQDPETGESTLESLTLQMWEPRNRPAEFVVIKIGQHTAEVQPGVYEVEIMLRDRAFEGTMTVRTIGRTRLMPGVR